MFGFVAAVADAEHRLAQELSLRALALPPELARLEGSWKGHAVTLSARAHTGPRIAYARFVTIAGGGLEIGNVLAFSRPEYPVPQLGADLVGLGKDTGVVVADLSPVPLGEAPLLGEAQLSKAELAQLRQLGLPPGGELPAWCQPWFSAQALYSRIAPPHAPAAARALALLCECFAQRTKQCVAQPARAAAVADWQVRYCAAHRQDDRGLGLLHKIFEPVLAERFLREVLFPEGARAGAVE